MIHDLTLRWVVTGLFALSAAECVVAIAIKRRPWTYVISHGLHFVMAVAMAAMAWPRGAQLSPRGPAVFFLLATVWFMTIGVVAARRTGLRASYGYHGLMMLATAWMYAIMDRQLLPVGRSTAMSMPGMDMAVLNMPASSGAPLWFGAVNWVGALSFAVAAVFWTRKYFTERQRVGSKSGSVAILAQTTMAGGTAILFAATLFRI